MGEGYKTQYHRAINCLKPLLINMREIYTIFILLVFIIGRVSAPVQELKTGEQFSIVSISL